MVGAFWRAAASILQYIVPLAFAAGALVSLLKRRKQSELHDKVSATSHRGALQKMSGRDFEDLTAEVPVAADAEEHVLKVRRNRDDILPGLPPHQSERDPRSLGRMDSAGPLHWVRG